MISEHSILREKSTLVIFAYAPAGFGHLRVTDALYHGLPSRITPLILGSQDESIRFLHAFMSLHPSTRWLMEYMQQDGAEDFFTTIYRWLLRRRTKLLYEQMVTLMEEQYHPPRTLVVVATHFGLAHQLGVIKSRLEKERDVRVFLILQVTDDSPQDMWAVPESDLTFVPSAYTQNVLSEYTRTEFGKADNQIVVNPYPISPALTKKLSYFHLRRRHAQLSPDHQDAVHAIIPISGAAVGMEYYARLIHELEKGTQKWIFHIVTKVTANTAFFINQFMSSPSARLYLSKTDREVVHAFEKVYTTIPISVEVTKPSEQAFKALLTPRQKGGAILFFSAPVGRQESDNLNFLRRHFLIPTPSEGQFLLSKALESVTLTGQEKKTLRAEAKKWRGIPLPHDPAQAATLIKWLFREGVAAAMGDYTRPAMRNISDKEELGSDGVDRFWDKVDAFLSQT